MTNRSTRQRCLTYLSPPQTKKVPLAVAEKISEDIFRAQVRSVRPPSSSALGANSDNCDLCSPVVLLQFEMRLPSHLAMHLPKTNDVGERVQFSFAVALLVDM